MKARVAFILFLVLIFGLRMPLRAADTATGNPRQYKPIDRKTLQNQIKILQSGRLTPNELGAISTQVHRVSVITVPGSNPDILPAATRPQGVLQLDKVITPPK